MILEKGAQEFVIINLPIWRPRTHLQSSIDFLVRESHITPIQRRFKLLFSDLSVLVQMKSEGLFDPSFVFVVRFVQLLLHGI